MGFEWSDPRFVSGRHLSRGDEVAWFDRDDHLHVTRYLGVFHESGYRIRRYVPSPSGDLEHRGVLVSRSLAECLYDRPGAAVHYHQNLSGVSLFIETLGGGRDRYADPSGHTSPLPPLRQTPAHLFPRPGRRGLLYRKEGPTTRLEAPSEGESYPDKGDGPCLRRIADIDTPDHVRFDQCPKPDSWVDRIVSEVRGLGCIAEDLPHP